MKRTYQIAEAKAIAKFQSHLASDPGAIQLVLPLAEVAQQLRQGVTQLLFGAELRLLELIMEDEVGWLTGKRYGRGSGEQKRWGKASGSVVIHGQKVSICRPRVRSAQGDVKLGSYELFRREEEMQRQVWERILRGLTTRGYGPAIRECGPAFGIQKSAVSEKFILASAQRVKALLTRDLSAMRFCAVLLDGIEYRSEHMLTALGIEATGRKRVLGVHQGASENQKVCEALLADLVKRGLDFGKPMLAVLDGSKALRAAWRKYAGEEALVQRCQIHKRRNVVGHFADQDAVHWERQLTQAYDQPDYASALRAVERIQREMERVNPSAARSLEEGLEETLTIHRLKLPAELRSTLRSTNPIESAFSVVRVACRNVKRWRPGDQRERWIGSGLLFAESKFRRIDGYRSLPFLVGLLEGQGNVMRKAAGAA